MPSYSAARGVDRSQVEVASGCDFQSLADGRHFFPAEASDEMFQMPFRHGLNMVEVDHRVSFESMIDTDRDLTRGTPDRRRDGCHHNCVEPGNSVGAGQYKDWPAFVWRSESVEPDFAAIHSGGHSP